MPRVVVIRKRDGAIVYRQAPDFEGEEGYGTGDFRITVPSGNKVEITGGDLDIGSNKLIGEPVAFSAQGSGAIIANNVTTKVLFGAEEFDTNSDFASDRFTPTVPGKYLLSLSAGWQALGATSEEIMLMLYKNGVAVRSSLMEMNNTVTPQVIHISLVDIVDADGSTDYFEMYVYQWNSSSANRNLVAGTSAIGSSRFQGNLIALSST